MSINSDSTSLPQVSVIAPAYNYGQFIGQMLESLQAQTFTDWECIVVDDGSTDDTAETVAHYAEKDRRIRYLWQENARQGAARNNGILHARGDYFQFLDADDLIEPRKLELQVAHLDQHPEVDITYSAVRYFTGENVSERRLSRQYSSWEGAGAWMPEVSGEGKVILPTLLRNNIMVVNSPLIRRRVIDDVGLFDVGLTPVEDWDYWIKCAVKGMTFRFDDIEGARALVRAHQLSSSKDQRRMLRATLRMRKKLATLLVDEEMQKLNRQKEAETEGHLGIEEVVNGKFSAGILQMFKAALIDPRVRFKAKWLICACCAAFVSSDRLKRMVTSSLTGSLKKMGPTLRA